MDYDLKTRYARQISLPGMGEAGQARLHTAKVLVIGAGGLGSPLLTYLAAAGVGTIGVVDDDRVALSNLHRQILFETADIGQPKASVAKDALFDVNPHVTVNPHVERLTADNVDALFAEYDIIADGCDDVATRFLVNERAYHHQKTLVSAAVIGFSGHLYTFKAHHGAPHPCYQCLYPDMPPADATPVCAEAGVLGSVAGQLATFQATEIIKEIAGIGESLAGYMLVFDALNSTVRKVKIPRAPSCPVCSKNT